MAAGNYTAQFEKATFDKVVFRGQAAEWRRIPTKAEWFGELPGEGYRIRNLRFEAVPGEEFRDVHPPPAFRLHRAEPQGALAGLDQEFVLSCGQHRAGRRWRPGQRHDLSKRKDFDS